MSNIQSPSGTRAVWDVPHPISQCPSTDSRIQELIHESTNPSVRHLAMWPRVQPRTVQSPTAGGLATFRLLRSRADASVTVKEQQATINVSIRWIRLIRSWVPGLSQRREGAATQARVRRRQTHAAHCRTGAVRPTRSPRLDPRPHDGSCATAHPPLLCDALQMALQPATHTPLTSNH